MPSPVLVVPAFDANPYLTLPQWPNRMKLGPVIAPLPNTGNARPSTGQCFPIGE